MTRLAIFSAPKPFVDPHITTIQRNAVNSWKALGERVETWLVGDEEGVAAHAKELGAGYLPLVERNSYGTPRIDSIFDLVRQHSSAEYLCYVNADILLFPDLLAALDNITKVMPRFLAIGRRWDASIRDALEIKPGWGEEFVEHTLKTARLHRAAGSDYFLFARDQFTDTPPFAVGRSGWDNWMIYKARVEHWPVIDATDAVKVIHQNHDFSHFADGKIHRYQPESVENLRLAGGRHTVFTIHDANYQFTDRTLKPIRLNRWKLVREISIFPSVTLHCSWLARVFYAIFNLKLILKQRRNAQKGL